VKSSDRRRAAASSAAGAASRSPPARRPARGGQQVAGLVGVVLVGALTRRHPGRVVGGQPGERVGVAGEDLLDEPGPVVGGEDLGDDVDLPLTGADQLQGLGR
jgi:hypothetical protein